MLHTHVSRIGFLLLMIGAAIVVSPCLGAQPLDQPPSESKPASAPGSVVVETVALPHEQGSGTMLWQLLILATLGFWLYMLVDVAKRRYDSEGEKIAWLLIVLLLNVLGAAVYAFAGRSRGSIARI